MHYGVTPGSENAAAAFRHALDRHGLRRIETLQLTRSQTVACDGQARTMH
jgi:hypothetical protein